MSKYQDLVRVLDKICDEAPQDNSLYHPIVTNVQAIEQARSRAYIHLFLKAKFGLLDFDSREAFITDGPADAGIDAFYIDKEHRRVYFIQSKFRNSDSNFEGKTITYRELLSMDVDRITRGETHDRDDAPYNDRIKALVDKLQGINNLGRYEFIVVIIANVKDDNRKYLGRIIGAFNTEVYDQGRIYEEILFPVISGTFYDVRELKIVLNISRESSGHRIQYYAGTEYGECTVNACFVPTIEIAKTLLKYKNSILKYNPRSYLELVRGNVNTKIADSILNKQHNEFALFNNGITMLSDETEYSDRSARRDIAELYLSNPQIINGGQTAYTLSRLYEDGEKNGNLKCFEGKEVLLKVISFNDVETAMTPERVSAKLHLIEQISVATNQQSPVSEADRRANDKVQVELQQNIFKDFGLYYERKRGEFSDGLSHGYITRNQLIDRDEFLRCRVAMVNPVNARNVGSSRLFTKQSFDSYLPDSTNYRHYVFAYKALRCLDSATLASANVKYYARYAIIYVVSKTFEESLPSDQFDDRASCEVREVLSKWHDFEKAAMKNVVNRQYYFKEQTTDNQDMKQVDANWQGYYKGRTLQGDLDAFFGLNILVEG